MWDFLFFRKAIEQIIFPPGLFLLLILLVQIANEKYTILQPKSAPLYLKKNQ